MDTYSLTIIATASLVAAACGYIGCFLVLRRMALLGDAISHSILLGIVVAFLITGDRGIVPMFIGAAIVGLITAVAVQALEHGGVQADAAIGVTFTAFFALGVVLLTLFAGRVHLDLDHVLYGEIAYVPWDILTVGGRDLGPRALWSMGFVALLNVVVVGLFFKELKVCAFDPGLAKAIGLNVLAFHYLLMGLVSLTAVAAFESVGAILAVAMLIVPGATAYLLTDDLKTMLGLSVLCGVLSAIGGYAIATWLDASIAGAMTTAAGLLFAIAALFSPAHGVLARLRARQRGRISGPNVIQSNEE